MKKISPRLFATALALTLFARPLPANVTLNGLFTDNMVLQSGQPVPIWGTADASETVTVEFAGQKKTADPRNGRWEVTLDPLAISADGQKLTITGHNTITLQNVVVGEVWLASGQSNMGFALNGANNADSEIPQATDPLLRFYTVTRVCSADVQTGVKGKWDGSTPDTAKNFSAVAYFFGKALRTKLKEPIGLINSSWGGTPAQAWTSMDAFRKDPPFTKFIDLWNKALADHQNVLAHPELEAAYQDALKKWQADVAPTFNDAMKAWNAAVAAKGAAAAGPKPTPSEPEPKNPDPTGMPNPSARPNTPSVIFNGMIAPLVPFAVKGVIWYQGEANGGQGFEYRTLFPRLITDWRTRWAQASFPFLYVQLPGWGANDHRPPDQQSWPLAARGPAYDLEPA